MTSGIKTQVSGYMTINNLQMKNLNKFSSEKGVTITSNQENTNFGQAYIVHQKITRRTDICANEIYSG